MAEGQKDAPLRVVVGLGNPGREHQGTRHNLGFLVADALAAEAGVNWTRGFGGRWARIRLGECEILLLEPLTFMNASGDAVQPFAAWHRVRVEEILVVHDDVDLPFGAIRLKSGGGHAGHNGLRSLVARLGQPGFARLRLGIGRPQGPVDLIDWVLGRFGREEAAALPDLIASACAAVRSVAALGLRRAMNETNGKRTAEDPPPPGFPPGSRLGADGLPPDSSPARAGERGPGSRNREE